MSLSLITGSLQDLKCLCTAFVCILDSPSSCEFDVLNCFCIYLPLTVACDCVAPVLSFYFPHFLSFIFLFPYTEIGGGKGVRKSRNNWHMRFHNYSRLCVFVLTLFAILTPLKSVFGCCKVMCMCGTFFF